MRPHNLRAQLALYWVTDPAGLLEATWLQQVQAAVRGGVSCVQLRSKTASTRDLVRWGHALKTLLAPHGVPLVINDRLDVALAVNAEGLHLGQSDLLPADARRLMPAHMWLGWSIEQLDQLQLARVQPVDYLAISPVFATPTKGDAAEPLGLAGLRWARQQTALPLVAIGGMHAGSLAEVVAAGADSVAVVRAISDAPDPEQAARVLRGLVDGALALRQAQTQARTESTNEPTPRLTVPRVLSIAGSDSGGGAGIQADLKTIAALGCFGTTAITAVTAQNTLGVSGIHALPAEFLARQIDAVLGDIGADAIKIGMLHDAAVVSVVAQALGRHAVRHVVLDPVMVATSGDVLMAPDTMGVLVETLLPRVSLVTPNLDELGLLCGQAITTEAQALDCAQQLLRRGARAVLVKGGHLPGDTVVDTLVDAQGVRLRLAAKRIATNNLHGTGCTLSSAIASFLARGYTLDEAVTRAHAYVRAALHASRQIHWGQGHGPLNHTHAPVALITQLVTQPITQPEPHHAA
jgi:hydroxymethylpyrimidine kinase/phosphomethylpyrimidine kinase/thiamine-phosphate diphosphorylase